MRLATIVSSSGPRLHVRGRSGYVDVGAESPRIDVRRPAEQHDRGFRRDKLPLPERRQLSDRNPVPSDDKGLSTVERPHDLTALVP